MLRFIIGEQAIETLLGNFAYSVRFIQLLDDTVKLIDSPAALVQLSLSVLDRFFLPKL